MAEGSDRADLERILPLLEQNGIDYEVEENLGAGEAGDPAWRLSVPRSEVLRAGIVLSAAARRSRKAGGNPDIPGGPAQLPSEPLFGGGGGSELLFRLVLPLVCFALAAWVALGAWR